ncbi:polysaccharide biosynthesis tyrosine autokinase [Leifsonia shinshuensis]|uniref:polysaccharide biosynthesis tyrosine autokinase n=1 Tax=Leifsonia shinshuensis TaxID=150026 RepID=UPI002857B195|nr:polysaccharide biosynthesis tyrosine autokinase [Leifsonia shinshuensis]MDR6971733.1 capsular exopolysaccharide synthesis family protein [Leifsonia shinshuensis]
MPAPARHTPDNRPSTEQGRGGDPAQHQFVAAFKRFWYIIALGAFAGLIGGWGLAQVATPVYTATSNLYFSLNFGGSANDLNQGSTYTQNQMLSFAQLAESAIVLQPVIDQLHLERTPASLADSIAVSTPQNTVILELSVTDSDPAQAADIANAVAATLGKKVEEIAPKSVTGATTVSVRTIQTAVKPEAPSSPNVRLNLVAGVVIGLLLGVLLVVLRELLDTRVRSADIAARVTGVPLLAQIQRLRRRQPSPILLTDPLSSAAEGYRRLRSSLEFVSVDSDRLAFVVTSSVPDEGKSLVSLNLALALTEGDRRVLLVDADLRRPTLAASTGLPAGSGLTSVLVGRASVAEVVQEWNGLDVITSGPIPPNPSELLSSRAMSDFIAQVGREYDVVVFDTPPMTAVVDAAVVARSLDGALVVADRTRVSRSQLALTMDLLEKSGVRVLGLVLNRVAPTKSSDSYYRQSGTEKSGWRSRLRLRRRASTTPPLPLPPLPASEPDALPAAERAAADWEVDDAQLDEHFDEDISAVESDEDDDRELANTGPTSQVKPRR